MWLIHKRAKTKPGTEELWLQLTLVWLCRGNHSRRRKKSFGVCSCIRCTLYISWHTKQPPGETLKLLHLTIKFTLDWRQSTWKHSCPNTPLAEVQTRCEKVSSQTCCGAPNRGWRGEGWGEKGIYHAAFQTNVSVESKSHGNCRVWDSDFLPLAALLVCFKTYFFQWGLN